MASSTSEDFVTFEMTLIQEIHCNTETIIEKLERQMKKKGVTCQNKAFYWFFSHDNNGGVVDDALFLKNLRWWEWRVILWIQLLGISTIQKKQKRIQFNLIIHPSSHTYFSTTMHQTLQLCIIWVAINSKSCLYYT